MGQIARERAAARAAELARDAEDARVAHTCTCELDRCAARTWDVSQAKWRGPSNSPDLDEYGRHWKCVRWLSTPTQNVRRWRALGYVGPDLCATGALPSHIRAYVDEDIALYQEGVVRSRHESEALLISLKTPVSRPF